MQNIIVNGKLEYIFNDDSIIDIIRKHTGDELADLIEIKINQADLNQLIAEEKSKTDCEVFERELDAHQSAFSDILDEIKVIQEHLNTAKKLDRKLMLSCCDDIEKEISNYY